MVFLMVLLDLNYYKTIEAYTCLSLWEKAGSQVTAMIWFIACIAGIILLKVEEIKLNAKWERQVQTQRRGLNIFFPESSLLTVDWSSSTSYLCSPSTLTKLINKTAFNQ